MVLHGKRGFLTEPFPLQGQGVLGAGNHGLKHSLCPWRSREALLGPAEPPGFLLVLDTVLVCFGPAQLGDVGLRFNGI